VNHRHPLATALALIVALVFALVPAAPAGAEPAAPEQEARRLYDLGARHYNLGEYAAAIEAYQQAYRLVAEPLLLYDIAQAFRLSAEQRGPGEPGRARELREALRFYNNFLGELPDAPNRAVVEDHITTLTRALALEPPAPAAVTPPPLPTPAEAAAARVAGTATGQAAPSTPPITAPAAPADLHRARPIYKRWWFWTGVGVLAAGATTLALTAGRDGPPPSDLGNFPVF